MYPVDVTSNSTAGQSCTTAASGCYYFVLDAGNYRLLAVNRVSHAIDWQIGGQQGNDPLAGSPPGSLPVQLSDARAVGYDSATGDVYVADTANNRVLVFSFSPTSGFSYLTQFGSKGTGNGQFNLAYGVAIDPVQPVGLRHRRHARADREVLDRDRGSPHLHLPDAHSAAGTLNQPRQVEVAPNGDVLVTNRPPNQKHNYYYVYSQLRQVPRVRLRGHRAPGTASSPTTPVASPSAPTAARSSPPTREATGSRRSPSPRAAATTPRPPGPTPSPTPAGRAAAAFVGLRGLTTTADDHLMVADEWGFDLHEFSFTPGTTTYASTYNNVPTAPPVPGVNAPRGVQVAANGDIYIMDYWNQRVEYGTLGSGGTIQDAQAFGVSGGPEPGWTPSTSPGASRSSRGRGTSSSPTARATRWRFSAPPATTLAIDGTNGTADGDFSFPQGIAFAPNGDLYVSDTGNDRIQEFTVNSNGTLNFVASFGTAGSGSSAPAGELNQPTGIAVSPDGSTLWVADTLNNRIQSLSLTGGTWNAPIHKTTGKGQQTAFSVPWGVTVAPDGSIWVSDTGNNRLVSMSTTGVLNWSVTGAQIGVPDGAQGNQTIYPFAVAFGSDSTVYLSDTWNNRVLVLTTS